MKVRQKTAIVIVLASIIMISILYLLSQTILLNSYAKLEEQNTKENVQRVISVLSGKVADLNGKCGNWAERDDAYRFVQDLNEEYKRANLVKASFINLRVNFILFVSPAGQLVSGMGFDLKNMTEMEIPQSVTQLLSTNHVIYQHENVNGSVSGIVLLPEGPLILASRPIVTSQREGPIQGALIFARYFDDDEMKLLTDMVHLPLVMYRIDDSQLPSDFQKARSSLSLNAPIFASPLNASSIGGYTLISDILGQSILIMRAEMARDVYRQGQTTVNFLVLSMIAACGVFSALILLFLEETVMLRLGQLTRNVSGIGKHDDLSARVMTMSGNDELSILTKSINDMLTEIENKTAKLQKSESFAIIGELATMVAHDLRNPLQGIANAVFYLKKNAVQKEGKQKMMLELIEEDVKYSEKIVSDLLDYSRGMQLHLEETSPKALIETALSAVEVPASITVLNETTDQPKLRADVLYIKRAFVNIIRNSVEAMPKGGTLTLRSRSLGNEVEFVFSDTGIGIHEENFEKIFTPLFTTKPKGMGFGLPICRRVIEAHGGKILGESTVGKGTTFTLTLPISPKLNGGENDWMHSPKSLLLTTTKV